MCSIFLFFLDLKERTMVLSTMCMHVLGITFELHQILYSITPLRFSL
jgi:hypothetical protein